ncbi:hypothetical protein PSU4_28780 [Pseudonocardia sulfidoxydans NBRC 16205]|uniref:Uncharacterized protein n=1 Tax=Pseudonocardia sulfidoxydans NBRC 16205 TaxID=1223511 RepID=A0A511DJF5_9PSEU|nr:RDD family protein [Pseudonocardia sulfidoxydans]GEL23924.1 hypothetical protein PSU4_28780 [Pseudonocardia sulfidoxydans NBRC 16205]
MSRWIDSWMPGSPTGSEPASGASHPGEKFGLPASGPGSVAGFWRRFGGVTIDWLLGYLVSLLFVGADSFDRGSTFGWTIWLVWFGISALAVAVFGSTPGMLALGMRAAPVDGRAVVGVPRAVVRTLLLGLVIPPLVRDDDGRGWHDRAGATVVIRTR